MSKLDEVIDQVAYVLESLLALQKIYNTGKDCNTCKKRNCAARPELGKQVRYNCAFYSGDEKEK